MLKEKVKQRKDLILCTFPRHAR